jgi:pimeloyl-ACP methyl ester carboxylesterase
MATPSSRRKPKSDLAPKPTRDIFARYPARPPAGPPQVVDPAWLLQALGLTVLGALLCGYLTLCLLVYQGQWQLVLHPDPSHPAPPASLPITSIAFGATESGQPRLAGWWIPAEPGLHDQQTILFLHDGSGNLASNIHTLEALHNTGRNVFALDFRGFGASDPTHPNQQRMTEDAESALDYLVNTRHLALKSIVPYGAGIGAALAAELAARHSELPALILESPQPDILSVVRRDGRARYVPLGVLFHERFDLAPIVSSIPTPKLILTAGPSPVQPVPDAQSVNRLAHSAANPSMIVHLNRPIQDATYTQALERFLDEYLSP